MHGSNSLNLDHCAQPIPGAAVGPASGRPMERNDSPWTTLSRAAGHPLPDASPHRFRFAGPSKLFGAGVGWPGPNGQYARPAGSGGQRDRQADDLRRRPDAGRFPLRVHPHGRRQEGQDRDHPHGHAVSQPAGHGRPFFVLREYPIESLSFIDTESATKPIRTSSSNRWNRPPVS